MKNEKLINDTNTKIESLIEKRRSDIKNIESAIINAKEGISKASQEMDSATFNENRDAYKKAKSDIDDYSVTLEMYERRLEQIRGSELIAESESVAVDESIVKAQDELSHDAIEKVRPILSELFSVFEEYRSEINALDNVRRDWRERVWKKQRKIGRNAFEIDIPKQYDDGGLSNFLNEIRGMYFVVNELGFKKGDTRTGLEKITTK